MFVEVHKFWWGTCRVGENIDFSRFYDVSGERVSHSGPACIVAQAKIETICYVSVWNDKTWGTAPPMMTSPLTTLFSSLLYPSIRHVHLSQVLRVPLAYTALHWKALTWDMGLWG